MALLPALGAQADFSFEHNEHTYKVVTTGATWSGARAAATQLRLNGETGYLAIIDSADENAAILNAIQNQLGDDQLDQTRAVDGGDSAFVWIGANDTQTEGVWLWDKTGEQFWAGDFNGAPVNGLYANWGVEPDNFGDQDAAGLGLEAWPADFGDLGIAGQWNDLAVSNALFYVVEFDTPAATSALALEEPANGEVYSGIGNLRGWAVSTEGVEQIKVYIDGEYAFDAPDGGPREDVAAAFPDIESAAASGYSLAFSYSSLGSGEHTIRVESVDSFGNVEERSATFTVVAFDNPFIRSDQGVDFSNAVFATEGDEIRVQNAELDGAIYDFTLKWRPAEQGLEIIQIDKLTDLSEDEEDSNGAGN
jgi:hypothetical protein